jgi:membrane protein implicated in regulation of membrane protease activity
LTKTEPVEEASKGVVYKCTFCDETDKVLMVCGFPLCPVHDKEIQESVVEKAASPTAKKTSKSDIIKARKSKIVNKANKKQEKIEATQEIFVFGKLSKVTAHHKKVKSKISKAETRKKQSEQRIARLEAKKLKAEERVKKSNVYVLSVKGILSDEEILKSKCLSGKTIQLFGKTKEGSTRVKIAGKWYLVSGHLVGEEPKLIEVVNVSEKRMKRNLRKEFGY